MFRWLILLILLCAGVAIAQPLPGTTPLQMQGDLSVQVVAGIHKFLDAYEPSPSKPDRARLAHILGVVEDRQKPDLQYLESAGKPSMVAQGPGYTVREVRWPVFADVSAEGLLLEPRGRITARVVALPDADAPPEALAGLRSGASPFAKRLVENGAQVLIPLLIDRTDTYSGVRGMRMTNMPHREFLWRLAYPEGRHMIGMEVQKTLAAIDWFSLQAPRVPVLVAGYGEGGLIAMHAAALDERIERVLVSGYFGPRRMLWKEPVYRDVWGLLPDFDDASIASLIAPRMLIIESAPGPSIAGPPAPTSERKGADPSGKLVPLSPEEVEQEAARIAGAKPKLVRSTASGSDEAISTLLGIAKLRPPQASAKVLREYDRTRFERQFRELIAYTQRVMRESLDRRAQFWSSSDRSSVAAYAESVQKHRAHLWDNLIGRLPKPAMPANPRSRLIFDEARFRGYEVVLDVYPNVFAYGYLLVPKDIRQGEKRAVVVCQHGLEGRPKDVADPKVNNATYNQFAVRLAEQGFVTFAPQNAYLGGEYFRTAQRKAHPFRLSLFSFITAQHQRILEWLGGLDFVDARRIGFYGLSYGGFTAMRVPALLENYALSICSGNFNEWVWKTASLDAPFVYGLTPEYEIGEFNFANLANHYELATLIFPRPFMVERGHKDGVSWDEWVAYEYAKVFRFYSQMGLRDRTSIAYFDGPHAIHGEEAFAFLKRHLQ
ncbi:MAG: hypothetical protein JNL98_06670 [Bryobacterales bacterium]|nr:hypothetical protein [Bryobacterales bacterium]